MSTWPVNEHADIMGLTNAAAHAAELGQWDTVAQCYHERENLLMAIKLSAREARDVMRVDEQIYDRVRTVQTVLMSLLGEATATRQRLQGLHQRLGVRPSTPVTISMKA